MVKKGQWHGAHSRASFAFSRGGAVLLLSCLCAFGCSHDDKKTPQVVDANAYPANYKDQIATFLQTALTNNADFRNSLISPPVMKPVGQNQHYVACVQLNGFNQHKDKAVIYFSGSINQFVDATGDECSGVAYEPFVELARLAPK
jgi:hypothetical protein